MTRRETVISQLLERYSELVDPLNGPAHLAGDGDALALMPRTYTASVRELERLLCTMREDRHRSLVRLPNGSKVSVRSLWWHLTERYLRSTTVLRDVRVQRKAKNGRKVTVIERQTVVLSTGRVSQASIDRGIRWLAEEWSAPFEPMLPSELLVAA